ncbi:Hypoxanthine phosphoribosyl transferase [Artemisia annua]|uniref:Hypoxanthine phosphoribosyl transferase n=1 Tax=Artemisia annua TaxID=35608 RepID=A0A2U1LBZ2_ARTAN|nr:Hypoxanthine phosphoribosyl transferase [Artemisia annua]
MLKSLLMKKEVLQGLKLRTPELQFRVWKKLFRSKKNCHELLEPRNLGSIFLRLDTAYLFSFFAQVEDIVDIRNTIARLISYLQGKGATSVSVCTLLDKPARRKVHFDLLGEGKFYSGFECPDSFVVGYGPDFNERYRNLPYIGVLKPDIYD